MNFSIPLPEFPSPKIQAITLCCTLGILTSCSQFPLQSQRQTTAPPPTAIELATTFSQTPSPLVAQPPSFQQPITDLPREQASPPKEVNRVGEVPKVETFNDSTLDKLDLEQVDTLTLDFEQVSLQQLIRIIGDSLKLNMVIDPSIGDKVTLRTSKDKPLRKQDLWPLLQLLLTDAGIILEQKGGVYHFKKLPGAIPGTIGDLGPGLTGSEAPEVLQIVALRYISAEAALAILNPLLQPVKGRIISLPNVNVLGIITSPQQLERVNKLLALVDADPFLHRGMRLFRLSNAKATEVQPELDKILQAISGKTAPAYQAIALERINSILVVSPPGGGFKDVEMWVNILDEKSEESREQIFIYSVRNLEAGKLAATLSDVFKTEEDEDEIKSLEGEEDQAVTITYDERGEVIQTTGETVPKPKPIIPPPVGMGLPISAELKVKIVADESTNSLLIRANARDYRQLLETIRLLDRVPKEVMVNVVIAEVTLTEASKFGIDWQAFFGSARGTNNRRSFSGMNFNVPGGNSAENPLTGFVFDHLAGSLNIVLNAIATTNNLKILSRPSLLVRNNEEASINVGNNEPYLGSINRSTVNNQNLTQDVNYKDTGITLKVTPRINDDGVINMKIYQELSQLGQTRTTESLQSFIQRKVETSVVVSDGNAIVIGGLIETRNRDDSQGIPILRDLPLVGNTLFSSTDREDVRTELVLIIVPQIVNPELDATPIMQIFRQRMQLVADLFNEQYLMIEGFTVQKPAP